MSDRHMIKLMLDSGAFSAWRLGKPVDLDDYCDYIEANRDWIDSYINLDVISPVDPAEAAKASYANFRRMRLRGLDPIPVFHVNEDVRWLDKMLEAGCTTIALSATSIVERRAVDPWYHSTWNRLVNKRGDPIVRAHALGEGRIESLRRFPWTSADMTSWMWKAQGMAMLFLPGTNGKKVSLRNDRRTAASNADVEDLDATERAALHKAVTEHGFNPSVLERRDTIGMLVRSYFVVSYFIGRAREINAKQPIRHRANGFFRPNALTQEGISPREFSMYFAFAGNAATYPIFARAGVTHMLASYFQVARSKLHQDCLKPFVLNPYDAIRTAPLKEHDDKLMEYAYDQRRTDGSASAFQTAS